MTEPRCIDDSHLVLTSVIVDLAEKFGTEELGSEVGGHMTCSEADLFAQMLAIGLSDIEPAARFLAGHSHADTEEDDVHPWIANDQGEPSGSFERVLVLARKYVQEVLVG